MPNLPRRRFFGYPFVLMVCVLGSFFCLAYPLYVIRPFRPQGVTELKLALAVLQYRTQMMLICAAVALFAVFTYWKKQPRRLRKVLAVTAAFAVCGFAALSRVNVYEQMFHPMGKPSFIQASQSTLNGAEKVLAVNLQGHARAYPIRSMAYHHIVNDTLGDVPIVATY